MTQATTDTIRLIPLDQIDAQVVTRDRTALDPDALGELRDSITRTGLRQPIEVFEVEEARHGCLYGLISGFRRFSAFRTGLDAHTPLINEIFDELERQFIPE